MKFVDESLQKGTDWVKEVFDRANYWHILLFVLANGFIMGLATTGYLKKSIPVFSLEGGLYLWQFFIMLTALTIKISPTSKYLVKAIVAGMSGFAFQWQTMAWMDGGEGFRPIMDNAFAIFLFYASFLGAMIYCFTNNEEAAAMAQHEKAELERLREIERQFKALQNKVPDEEKPSLCAAN